MKARRCSPYCHIALAPNPWTRRRLGLDRFGDLGIQQCIAVDAIELPCERSVVTERRPAFANDCRNNQSLDAVKLKHRNSFKCSNIFEYFVSNNFKLKQRGEEDKA